MKIRRPNAFAHRSSPCLCASVVDLYSSRNPTDARAGCSRNSIDIRSREVLSFAPGMNIVKATRRFEQWLGKRTTIVRPDLRLKHLRMAESAFPFLRATFYRWMQVWPEVCADLADSPRLLAVGDLHVENFGTWRDIEGRLVWGVNDFDEAAVLPYTIDLVRLAVSAALAINERHLSLKVKDACEAILRGYRESLVEGGLPFVLEEQHSWLREVATGDLRDPVHFWEKMDHLPRITRQIPGSARKALEKLLPEPSGSFRTVRRVAGLGSLGHVRVVAIAECHGAKVAREAKALVPSSAYWAEGRAQAKEILYQKIIDRAVRCPDPFVELRGDWLVRRLSPHCSRIELNVLPAKRDELRLLHSMGWETANIHLGSPKARKDVRRHLDRMKPGWLLAAAQHMVKVVTNDWRAWKKSGVGPTDS